MPHPAPFQINRGLRLASSRTAANIKVFEQIEGYTVSVNPGSIAANDGDVVAVTVTGAKVGDLVMIVPPAALEAGLFAGQPWVSAANTVQLPLYNYTAGAVDGAALDWVFVLLR